MPHKSIFYIPFCQVLHPLQVSQDVSNCTLYKYEMQTNKTIWGPGLGSPMFNLNMPSQAYMLIYMDTIS